MADALVVLVALAALPILVRLGFGGGGGRVVLRWRVPLRHRFPRLFWSAVWFGVLVVLPVGWLGSACGWWGP
ncbi:hypothetical protein [Actinomadura monticuli]|uniref:Uncharacterized protein n=1 Tax=Actinomadura monticuli TaxID=3097367 RepID=A0ABV4QB34_9ACTN